MITFSRSFIILESKGSESRYSDNNNNNKIKWIKFLEHGIKVQSAKRKEELLHMHEEEQFWKESKWSMNPMKFSVALWTGQRHSVLVKNNEDEKGLSRDELYLLAWAIWYAYVLVKNNEDEKGLSRDELYLLACLRSFMHMHMYVPPQDVEISRTAIQDMITPKVASILQVVFYDTSRLRVLVLCPVLEP